MEELSKLLKRYQELYKVDIHLELYPDLSGLVIYSNTGEQVFDFDNITQLYEILQGCE